MNAALIQKHFSKTLSLGQTLLLQKTVEALTGDAVEQSGSKTADEDAGGTGQDMGPAAAALNGALQGPGLDAAALMQLLGQAPAGGTPAGGDTNTGATLAPTGTPGKAQTFDPFDVPPTGQTV